MCVIFFFINMACFLQVWSIILTGSRYTVDPTTQVGPTEAVGSLSIRDVVAGDFGAYVCIAQNSNGQAHKTVLLTVKSEYHCKSLPLNEGLSLLYLVRVRLDRSRRPDRVGQRTHWESPAGSPRVALRQSYNPPAVDPQLSPGSWLPAPHLSSSQQTSNCPWNTLPPYRRYLTKTYTLY